MFRAKILKEAETKDTRLILNLDISMQINSQDDQAALLERAFQICRSTKDYLAAVKTNRQFADAVGLLNVRKLIEEMKMPFIADFKIADIDNTAVQIASNAYFTGYDAIIMHAFVGRDPIQAVMKEFPNLGIIAVVAMTHPGAKEFILPNTPAMCKLAKEVGVAGVIAPGNKPEHIKPIREAVGNEILLLCPGLGAQGGVYGDALRAGADFEMVGRSIFDAKDPAEEALKIMEQMREARKK